MTTFSSTKPVPRAAALFCRPSPTPWAIRWPILPSWACLADAPVDLGSRCTVFMNSSVKQAQKDGASVENISAGLSISVVKNALYKVIRATSPQELGEHIVVQGGTFLNDAVLRAFEQEMGVQVVRPSVAGLMGAYGAALYAMERQKGSSTLLGPEELQNLTHKVQAVECGLCQNHCQLTVNQFGSDRRFISGNRCERPVTHRAAGRPAGYLRPISFSCSAPISPSGANEASWVCPWA